MSDAIVIGAGINGLVTATLLGRSGRSVVVLERNDRVGGCAWTSELAPGFRCPTLAHCAALDPALVRSLGLERHGLTMLRPQVDACAPAGDGRALVLWNDRRRAAEEIRAFSSNDAERYPPFLDSFARISGVLRGLNSAAPPDLDRAWTADVLDLLKTGRRFRALGKADAYRLLRWMPMAVADFTSEWFDSEPLRATIAASGVLGAFLGPRSAGSAAQLLLLGAGEGRPIANSWLPKGGPGALTGAVVAAARAAGVEIRVNATVAQIEISGDAASGVTLSSGETLTAPVVISNADPKHTLLGLVDPIHLAPDTLRRVQNIRANGTLAKINYAVTCMPALAALANRDVEARTAAMSGRIRLAPDTDHIERAFDAAKYGGFSTDPWIELTVPSIIDPSLAPLGQHVVSAYVQYAPYRLRETTWDSERDSFGDATTSSIERYIPGFAASIVAREVITPLDLERTYGLTGGHIFHGELALDQTFVTRPLLGWARYATPIRNLFLCGSGTHPGTGLDGRSGANAAKAIVKALGR